ncbi:PadR family transcriptional regulator [Rhodococcus sp. Z13]|uniref:PadR family transcriptional regulator n=1 Tax=Rhodococcus sacchari TaxID=2962047 RepID=A0ACD4DGP6_9NOCA|nr:PadR family transcriptional regulator [Rhodococcus sp. Z13]UYP19260.1 PadR family transcriptional regulator [Rhodococcus sp. Z13]
MRNHGHPHGPRPHSTRRDRIERTLPGGPFRPDGPRRRGPHPHGDGPFPHPRHGGPGHRGGRRGRAQRGDVRAAVLRLLATEPMHGYQLMEAVAERTGGAWRPSPGAIYPTLSQLEDEGLVTVEKEGGRKLASLTEAGRAYLDDPENGVGDPFAGHTRDAAGPDLRGALRELQDAVRAVAVNGTDADAAAAHAVLVEARRSVYRILAGDAVTPGDGTPTTPED